MLNKRFCTKNGFTLVELLVTTVLVSILVLAIMNQLQVVGLSKRAAVENLIINRLTDRLAVELSRQETCSSAQNLGGLALTASATQIPNLSLVDAVGNPIVEINKKYGFQNGQVVSGNAASLHVVEVSSITTRIDPNDSNQLDLEISFNKKTGIGALTNFMRQNKINLPLTIVKNSSNTQVDFCYSDITNSIISAIRLSCQGNNSYYDPTSNPPYGSCKHNIDFTNCPAGQFIQRAEIDPTPNDPLLSGKLKFTCGALPACPISGQFVKQVNLDGSIVCDYPLPNCAVGELIYKSSSGPYMCLGVNTCLGTNAVRRIDSNGAILCAQYFPPNTCPSGRATYYDPSTGNQTCAPENFKPVTCPAGYYISRFDSTGTAQCTKYITASFNCGFKQGATGVDASGNLICQQLQRRWCNGTANTHMNSDCPGTIVNPGPNQVCKVAGATCPGGWTQCGSWGETATPANCTDTNSACTLPMSTRYSSTVAFTPSWSAPTVQCHYYAEVVGDGIWGPSNVCTDYPSSGPVGTGVKTSVGCY